MLLIEDDELAKLQEDDRIKIDDCYLCSKPIIREEWVYNPTLDRHCHRKCFNDSG